MSTMTTAACNPEPTPGFARATYQDVLDTPAHRVAEVVKGVLHTHPRLAMPHALVSSVLGRRVSNPHHGEIGGPGGLWVIDEPEQRTKKRDGGFNGTDTNKHIRVLRNCPLPTVLSRERRQT